ncbi:hypothetical protein [Rhizobium rhizogenes]|jgi:hypothetical protein|uniref:hypothetical protein n=1 Tax=Rhizobium rhizogenes TaxID=359 RepID=UPI0015733B43|nr:hypothetical protein [Rhizobium rhizogenes]NTG45241.1 hypothetical protein [Rhizobium rhizogenes]
MTILFKETVSAAALWTYLCDVKKGQTYAFSASGKWTDWFIDSDANGYERFWLKPFASRKRMPKEKWFALIGVVDKDMATAFKIGTEKVWPATATGKLWCFANDDLSRYGNNKGTIEVSGRSTSVE